jgi:hypothetical protein
VLKNPLNGSEPLILISHIYPLESNFEETKSTLQYTQRCQIQARYNLYLFPNAFLSSEKRGVVDVISGGNQEKLIKKLRQENAELRNKFEKDKQVLFTSGFIHFRCTKRNSKK